MRADVVLKKSRGLIVIFLSLTLITAIAAGYGIAQLTDVIWTYSDSSRTVEATEFGDGDTVYLKVTDTKTKGGTKAITVQNTTVGNTISVNVTDSNSDSFYLGSFIVYSGANDDANDKLSLFDGQSATITADLAADGTSGTETITAAYGAPSPTNLTATAIAGGSIELTWTPSSPETNVAQYYIYRSTTSGGQDYNSPLATVSAGTTTYTDSATTDGVTYYYVVRARDLSGNFETNTNEAIATADATSPPSPSNLTATPISEDGIQLSWTASSPETDVTQYNIYRATSLGAEDYSSPTYTVSVGITTYTDSAATPGQTYYYVVRAQDAAGNTDTNTNEVSATADANYQFVKSGIGLARGINYIAVQSMDKAGNKSKLSKTLKFAYNPEGLLSVVFRSTHVVRRDSPIGIIYSVTQTAEIVIRVYNLNGELVKEWKGNASPGVANEWKWYGKNMYEEEVNNGVYICRISAKSNGSRESKIKLLAVLR